MLRSFFAKALFPLWNAGVAGTLARFPMGISKSFIGRAVLWGGALVAMPEARALNIVINAGPGLQSNAAALSAFQRAAQQWMNRLTDPVTVTIDADLAALGPGIIGSTSSVTLQGSGPTPYADVRDLLAADGASQSLLHPDNAVVAHVPTFAQISANIQLPAGRTVANNMFVTKANLKAMVADDGGLSGLTVGDVDTFFGVSDATITFSSNFSFDYDNSNGVGGALMDFETVAAHELGHALGFVSAVDDIDETTAAGYPNVMLYPLDLYRFAPADAPGSATGFETAPRTLIPGTASVLSDTVNLWNLSTGVTNGDGRQASHFKDDVLTGSFIGIMDPTLSFGVIETPTAADFRAFDLIGWNLAPIPVPEPGVIGLAAVALALAGRRRTRRG